MNADMTTRSSVTAAANWGLGLSLVSMVIQWLVVGLFIWQLPPEIPLWYSLPAGKLQLATREWFFLVPGLSAVIFLADLIWVRLAKPATVPVYVAMMAWLTALSVFLATVAMIHVVLMAL